MNSSNSSLLAVAASQAAAEAAAGPAVLGPEPLLGRPGQVQLL